MRTIEKKLFKYEELSDKAKEKAREEYNDQNEYIFLSGDMQVRLEEILEENKITWSEKPKLFYSLNYSQGDGACFTGDFEWEDYLITVTPSHISNMYSHEKSTCIEVHESHGEQEIVDDETHDKIKELYYNICIEVKDYGYKEIEYQGCEEYLLEAFETTEFHEDGSIFTN